MLDDCAVSYPFNASRSVLAAVLVLGLVIAGAGPAGSAERVNDSDRDASNADDLVFAKSGGGGGGGSGGGGGGGSGGGGGAGGGSGGSGGGSGGGGAGGGAGTGGGGAGGAGAPGGGEAGSVGGGAAGSGAGSLGGGDGAVDGSAASATSASAALLAQARAALGRRDFREALGHAEAVVRAGAPDSLRAPALLVSGDAAYALQSYGPAAARYEEYLAKHRLAPDAARAAMALGWAELRNGRRERARQAWTRVADHFAGDARAPLALALAAEVASPAGKVAAGERLITQYPASSQAGIARLNRSIVALRAQREGDAVRDLDEVIRTHGVAVIGARRALSSALATPGGEAALEPTARPRTPASGDQLLERFGLALDEQDDNGAFLLHGLVLLAAADHGWSSALVGTLASRLAEVFPSHDAAPSLLARVAASAATASQWPTARRAYETLLTRYPGTPIAKQARIPFAEVLLQTGSPASLLSHARLLEEFGQPERAEPLLRSAVEHGHGEVTAEAAYRLGQRLRARGDHTNAVEWYMTAAYVAERSSWGPLALLSAGTSLTALGETDVALAVYQKLAADGGETGGEAAYRAGELFHGAGRHGDALWMFLTSAHVTPGSPAEGRALVAALQCLMAIGDHRSAEAVYDRLLKSSAVRPEVLVQARNALQNGRSGAQ